MDLTVTAHKKLSFNKMRRVFAIVFMFSTCLLNAQQLDRPDYNLSSGFYLNPVQLIISHVEPGVQIYYTTNGSEPTTSDMLYTGPITLQSRIGEANGYSEIPTNPSFVYPLGDYTTSRANNRGWLMPYSEVFKINVIRAKAFKTGYQESKTRTGSFIVDAAGAARYTLPILSLNIDSSSMFSGDSGIYVYGNHPFGNYTQKGDDWERIAHVELIDQNSISLIDQDIRIRTHGGGSRHSAKKNLRMYGEYDNNTAFDVELFEGSEQTAHKRLLIRAGGHRPDCLPRDDMANRITEGTHVDQQHYRQVIMFVNGEYWGIHSLKERADEYFFQNAYGIDDNDLTVLDQEYDIQGNGNPNDSIMMENLEDFIINNDLSIQANYDYVADRIDIDNYIDYMCSEIFLSNEDWVYSNVVLWRKSGALAPGAGPGQDGKFRWMMYDMDGAFGGSCSNAYYTINTLEAATVETGIYTSYTRFFRGLLDSDIFRNKFINRMCDLTNSWFRESVVNNHMTSFYNDLTPEMMENVERWRYPSLANNLADRDLEIPSLTQWDTLFYYFNRFANNRPRKVREHMMLKWSLSDSSRISVDVNDITMGRVQVHSILINDKLPGVSASVYPWIGNYMNSVEVPLIAVPLPGYEFVEWQGTGNTNDTIYWNPNGDSSFTAIFQPSSLYLPVVINEVMLSNNMFYPDNFNEYDDWLELYNPNPFPVNLSSCIIHKNGLQWDISENTIIEANGYSLFWHDGETYQGSNHTSYRLQNQTDTVKLLDPVGRTIDSIAYTTTPSDQSFGRYPNGSGTFTTFIEPTPLENNDYTGVDDIITTPLSVYPNPTRDQIFFNKMVNIQVYDLSGRFVLSKTKAQSINLEALENGIYLIKTDKGETAKIVLRH